MARKSKSTSTSTSTSTSASDTASVSAGPAKAQESKAKRDKIARITLQHPKVPSALVRVRVASYFVKDGQPLNDTDLSGAEQIMANWPHTTDGQPWVVREKGSGSGSGLSKAERKAARKQAREEEKARLEAMPEAERKVYLAKKAKELKDKRDARLAAKRKAAAEEARAAIEAGESLESVMARLIKK